MMVDAPLKKENKQAIFWRFCQENKAVYAVVDAHYS